MVYLVSACSACFINKQAHVLYSDINCKLFFLTWSTKNYYSKPFPWEVRMTLLCKMSRESLMPEWDFWGSTLFYRVCRTGVLPCRWVFLPKFQSRKSFPQVPRGVSLQSLLSCWPSIWKHHSVGHQFPSSSFQVLFVCLFNSTQSRTALWSSPIIIILFGQPCVLSPVHGISSSLSTTQKALSHCLINFHFTHQLSFLRYLITMELAFIFSFLLPWLSPVSTPPMKLQDMAELHILVRTLHEGHQDDKLKH